MGSPFGSAIADFNGDGLPDIAACNTVGDGPSGLGASVSVLLHAASSNYPVLFQPWANYAVPAGSVDAAAADMNQDGRPDLIVHSISFPNDTISVLRSTGPSFRLVHKFALTAGEGTTLVSDLNGDGFPDVVTSDGSGVAVLLAVNGDSLAPPVHYPPAQAPRAVADATGDGIKDIVALGSAGTAILIFAGNGSGAFNTSPISLTVPSGAQGVAVAFLNGDSFPDLITAPNSSNAVRVFYGMGGGAFQAQPDIPLGATTDQVLAGDVDGDGDTDIVSSATGGTDASRGIFVIRNNGNGTFTPTPATGLFDNGEVALSDVDQDGRLDLVAPTYDLYDLDTHTIGVLLNDGTGGFRGSLGTNDVARVSLREAVADFNGDGMPDVAISDSSAVRIRFGNGTGTFATSGVGVGIAPSTAWPSTLVPADVDLDGKTDLLVQVPDLSTNPPGKQVNFYRGLGNGSFSAPSTFQTGLYPRSLANMDGDGKPEVVGVNYRDSVLAVYGYSGGAFTQLPTLNGGKVTVGLVGLCLGDWNRDGHPDAALVGDGGLATVTGMTDGSGHWVGFTAQTVVQSGRAYRDVCTGDFNRDGILDLAAREVNFGADNLSRGIDVFLGTSGGGFGPAASFGTVDQNGATIETWDANRDGVLDLMVSGVEFNGAAPAPTGIDLLLGDGEGRFGLRTSYALGFLNRNAVGPTSVIRPVTVGDVNLDGTPDILAGVYTDSVYVFGVPLPVSLQVLLSAPPSPPVSGVETAVRTPSVRLAQNAPNPFNPSTTIRFALPGRDHVLLSVYDVSGRLVSVLADKNLEAGPHMVSWNGSDREGRPAGSGVYFYRLVTASGHQESKRMVLVR